jgi:hypothetical protein
MSARVVRVFDVAIVVWTIAWVALAYAVATEIHALRALTVTVVAAGIAAEEAGRAAEALAETPLIGEDFERAGERAQNAGASAQESGATSARSVDRLSVLLGTAIGVLATVPILAVWIPLRLRRRRNVEALRRAVARHGEDEAFLRWLALRAAQRMPYARLVGGERPPWSEIGREETRRLARMELAYYDPKLARW